LAVYKRAYAKFSQTQSRRWRQLQRGPKNRTCLSVDKFATISGRKACDMSKVSKCFKKA